ncbi:hypothetical protein [Candidatus Magnetaquicoccus inordinatus]|uniref:hypothetical protein n=1 Tax=Candidatus Magnetaquicoccus inordinatus TaxID=2496818 RepID=UPI00187D3C02|nr:hypothetical protein [Candidatus Magnetaquicoccus inordinatus]
MVIHFKGDSEELYRWRSIKHSLLLVTAIFCSTLLVVAFSTAVQKATYFVSHSIR